MVTYFSAIDSGLSSETLQYRQQPSIFCTLVPMTQSFCPHQAELPRKKWQFHTELYSNILKNILKKTVLVQNHSIITFLFYFFTSTIQSSGSHMMSVDVNINGNYCKYINIEKQFTASICVVFTVCSIGCCQHRGSDMVNPAIHSKCIQYFLSF